MKATEYEENYKRGNEVKRIRRLVQRKGMVRMSDADIASYLYVPIGYVEYVNLQGMTY